MSQKDILYEGKLPSGKKLAILKGKGRHLFNAMNRAREGNEIMWELIAQLITIDDQKIVMHDLYEMDLADVLAIQSAFFDLYQPFLSTLKTSLPSQDTQAGVTMSSKE